MNHSPKLSEEREHIFQVDSPSFGVDEVNHGPKPRNKYDRCDLDAPLNAS